MSNYQVTWEIYVDALTHEEAVRLVWNNYLHNQTDSSHFTVRDDFERVLITMTPKTGVEMDILHRETF